VVIARHTPTCNTESNTNFGNQKPLTLALFRRERGLTGVNASATPTWDTESYAIFKAKADRLPLLGERAGVRGESTTNPKPTAPLFTTQQ
jgi:hypothetical protein